MNTQTPLTTISQWVENYPTGYINMKDRKKTTFKQTLLSHTASVNNSKEILKQGDNTKIKEISISNKEKVMKPTTALTYENFSTENFYDINMSSHMNPIWVIVIFLLSIWIIYYLAK